MDEQNERSTINYQLIATFQPSNLPTFKQLDYDHDYDDDYDYDYEHEHGGTGTSL